MDTLTNWTIFENDIHFSSSSYANTSFVEMWWDKYVWCKKYSYTSSGYSSTNWLCKVNNISTNITYIYNSGIYATSYLKVLWSEIFFYSYSSTYGGELYKTDGTTTSMIKDLRQWSQSWLSWKPMVFNNKIYFIGTTDGTTYSIYSY